MCGLCLHHSGSEWEGFQLSNDSKAAFKPSWLPFYLWTTRVANGPKIWHQQSFLSFPSFLYHSQSLHLTLKIFKTTIQFIFSLYLTHVFFIAIYFI